MREGGGQSQVKEAAELATDGGSMDDACSWTGVNRVGGGTLVPEAVHSCFSGHTLREEGEKCAYCLQSPICQSFALLGIVPFPGGTCMSLERVWVLCHMTIGQPHQEV